MNSYKLWMFLIASLTINSGIRADETLNVKDLEISAWRDIWRSNAAGPNASFEYDQNVFASKPASLRLDAPEGAGAASVRSWLLGGESLPKGRFTVRGKIRGMGTGMFATVSIFGRNFQWGKGMEARAALLEPQSPQGQWIDFEKEVDIPAGIRRIELVLSVVQGYGSVWLDDLSFDGVASDVTPQGHPSSGSTEVYKTSGATPYAGDSFTNDLSKHKSWREAGWSEPWNHSNHMRLDRDDEGRQILVVDVNVASGADIKKLPGVDRELRVRAGKVYRIEFEAKAVGQVEFVLLHFRQSPAPHRWHGTDTFPVIREWTRFETQIKPRINDDQTGLFFEFRGIGEYQFRSVKVTEMDDYDVSFLGSNTPNARGELLKNPGFRFGSAGWFYNVPEWGKHGDTYYSDTHDRQRFFEDDDRNTGFRSPKGMFGFLSHTGFLKLEFGRSYRIRVLGEGADGDVFSWIERPRQHLGPVEKNQLVFRDGMAEVIYTHSLPPNGTLSIRPQNYFFLVEHKGNAPLEIRGVSVVELDDTGTPPPQSKPRGSVVISGLSGPLDNLAMIGQPLKADIKIEGLPDGRKSKLILVDGRGDQAGVFPLNLRLLAKGVASASVDLTALPVGWYEASLEIDQGEINAVKARFTILPPVSAKLTDKAMLGMHIDKHDPRQQPYLALLGTRVARSFQFAWTLLEPKKGEYNFPMYRLDRYLNAGIDPMIILNGSPHWASSAPEKLLENRDPSAGWGSYPPKDMEDWRKFVSKTATLLKGKVSTYQIWNEPNGYFLKVNPEKGKSLEEAYVELVRVAYEAIKKVDPDAVVVAGATAGTAFGFTERCFALGMLDFCDVFSYHPYGTENSSGAVNFAVHVNQYRSLMKKYGEIKPIWDCESGYNIADGLDGFSDAVKLIQGLVGREAAGIERYYVYTSGPRLFPGQTNFHMVTGFADEPLVSTPMLAVYDRLLGDARFVESLDRETDGVRLYLFENPEGQKILVGWYLGGKEAVEIEYAQSDDMKALDIFGNPATGIKNGQLQLVSEPRYFIATP